MADSEVMDWRRQIRRLEELAALRMDDEERRSLALDLQRIAEYVSRLPQIEENQVADVVDWHCPLADDVAQKGLDYESVFANAPKVFCDMFVMPPIIKERR